MQRKTFYRDAGRRTLGCDCQSQASLLLRRYPSPVFNNGSRFLCVFAPLRSALHYFYYHYAHAQWSMLVQRLSDILAFLYFQAAFVLGDGFFGFPVQNDDADAAIDRIKRVLGIKEYGRG